VQIHRSRFSILNSANDSPLIRTASARPATPPPLEKLAAAFRAPASVFRFCFLYRVSLMATPFFYSTLHSILFPPSGVGVSPYVTSSMGLICDIFGCCSLYLYTSPPHPLLAPLHCPLEYVRVRECVCVGEAGRYGGWFVPASSYYRHGHVFIFCASVRSSERRKKLFFTLLSLYYFFFYGMAVVDSILPFAESFTMCFYFIILLFFLRVPFFFRLVCVHRLAFSRSLARFILYVLWV